MWVMTERKILSGVMCDVGSPVPAGFEGRPFTRQADEGRAEDPAPNRMATPAMNRKRGRPRRE